MKISLNAGIALVVLAAALSARSQAADENQTSAQALLSSPGPAQAEEPPAGEVIREIDDPHSGDLWLLRRNPTHPAGPGWLVRIAGIGRPIRQSARGYVYPAAALAIEQSQFAPVIHSGDSLIIEERTALVEARLEAVALGPAVSGRVFNARLRIGGTVVRAVATGPGRAAFAQGAEMRP